MKYILFIPLFLLGFWACSNDESSIVHIDLDPSQAFSFKAIPGGSVMYYTLPADPEIVGLQICYNDIFGNKVIRTGSSSCDSLELVGFNEKQEKVEAQVTFCFYDDRISQPFDVTFSTEDSGPITFIKSVNVLPNWGGFTVSFNNPNETKGMAHVFYLGTDPVSNLSDTILVNSFLLEQTDGEKSLSFHMKQDIKDPTIVVRVEDFRGYMVNERVWENVQSLVYGKLDVQNFNFLCDRSIEHKGDKLGVEYLFDGDTKGVIHFVEGNKKKCCTFLTGPYSAGENAVPMFLDLKQNRIIASIRLYSYLKNQNSPSWYNTTDATGMNIVQSNLSNELPCEVTIYGLKAISQNPTTFDEINAQEDWVKLGTYKENKLTPQKNRWCKSCEIYPTLTQAQVEAADPEYMEIIVPATGQEEGYRYVKIVINEVYAFDWTGGNILYHNPYKYVSFHELEIYTAQD